MDPGIAASFIVKEFVKNKNNVINKSGFDGYFVRNRLHLWPVNAVIVEKSFD